MTIDSVVNAPVLVAYYSSWFNATRLHCKLRPRVPHHRIPPLTPESKGAKSRIKITSGINIYKLTKIKRLPLIWVALMLKPNMSAFG
jgi:hypothetical protein